MAKQTNQLPKELKHLDAKKLIPPYYMLGSWEVRVLMRSQPCPKAQPMHNV